MKISQVLPVIKRQYAFGDTRYLHLDEFNLIKKHELNSELHRTINIEEITSPYILVCGCSNSMGESITKEQTYSYLLSKNLNMPVYNMSISASGCDFISNNVKEWISNFPIKPSSIIVQWSHPTSRFSFCKTNQPLDLYLLGPWVIDENFRHDLWKKETELQKVYRTNLDNILDISLHNRLSLINFLDNNKIKLIEIMIDDDRLDNLIQFSSVDRGADGAHPGPHTHLHIANTLTTMLLKQ